MTALPQIDDSSVQREGGPLLEQALRIEESALRNWAMCSRLPFERTAWYTCLRWEGTSISKVRLFPDQNTWIGKVSVPWAGPWSTSRESTVS